MEALYLAELAPTRTQSPMRQSSIHFQSININQSSLLHLNYLFFVLQFAGELKLKEMEALYLAELVPPSACNLLG
jgi:hypothetical protein